MVKKLTTCGLLTALCVLFLFLGSILPNVQIAVAAAAGLLPAVAVLHCGCFWSLGVFAASGLLGFLLFPQSAATLWFLLLFGHYPVWKSLAERIPSRIAGWAVKLVIFTAAVLAMYFLFSAMFAASLPAYSAWLVIPALLVCLIVYDIAFTRLITFYIARVKPHVDK